MAIEIQGTTIIDDNGGIHDSTTSVGTSGYVLSSTGISTFWKSPATLQNTNDIAASTESTTIDFSLGNIFVITMESSTTFIFSNMYVGQQGVLFINQDATGGRVFTLPAIAKTPKGGLSIAQVTTANTKSILSFVVLNTTNVYVNYIGDFA